jgi:hypothetical protein
MYVSFFTKGSPVIIPLAAGDLVVYQLYSKNAICKPVSLQ